MSDAPATKYDPTESIRTLTAAPFKERYLTAREHQETDKHYIGDSLPVPAPEEAQPGSILSSTGDSPFPARADHTHGARTVWGYFNSGYKNIPPGRTYLNNFAYTGYGRQMQVTQQVFGFPFPGVWSIFMHLVSSRNGGGIYTGEMNIVFTYFNGGQDKTVWRQSNYDLPSVAYISVSDIVLIVDNPVAASDNFQVAVEHNDSVNMDVAVDTLYIVRLSDQYSS